jgi:hypothetical protein
MPPADRLLAYLQLLLGSLEPYLLSNEVFWPVDPGTGLHGEPASRLSLGAVALTLDRLAGAEAGLSPAQQSRLLRLQQEWDARQTKWRVAMERKALLETRARLRLWSAYLDDLAESEAAREEYPHEVRQRVMVARLVASRGRGEEAERQGQQAGALDARLRAGFVPGAFVWEMNLAPVYPAPDFWFLYGRPAGYLA